MANVEARHRDEIDCKHLGRLVARRIRSNPNKWTPLFKCDNAKRGGECTPNDCSFCQLRVSATSPTLPLLPETLIPTPPSERIKISQLAPKKKPSDSLSSVMCNRDNQPMLFNDAYFNAGVFLLLTGPSLANIDGDKLNQRGIVTFGVNQSPAVFRPNLWTCVDPLEKFQSAIFRDPGITKFIPLPRYNERIRDKSKDGTFTLSDLRARDCPNSYGVVRSCDFNPKTFFNQGSVNWGNGKSESMRNGYPHILNIMFFVIGICHHLGFKRIYLCGCDFSMQREQPYAFNEHKSEGACKSNNRNYEKMELMFSELRPYLENEGISVRNATPNSGFSVFDRIDFNDAVQHETKAFDNATDTLGYYIKEKERRSDSRKERNEQRERRKQKRGS